MNTGTRAPRRTLTATTVSAALIAAALSITIPTSAPAQSTDPTPTVISSLPIQAPGTVAFDPATNTLIVPGFNDGVVHLVDPAIMTEKAQVQSSVPGYELIQLAPDLGRAYLLGTEAIVTVIDMAAGTQVAQIPLAPEDVNATGSVIAQADVPLLWITFAPSSAPGALALVSTATNFRRGTLVLPFQTGGLALPRPGQDWVISNPNTGTVTFLDYLFLTANVELNVGGNPGQVLASPDGTKVYVVNPSTGRIEVLSSEFKEQVGYIDVGAGVNKIAISADGQAIVALNPTTNELLNIDAATGKIQTRGIVGTEISGITFGTDNRIIYATDKASNALLTVDLAHVAPASPATVRVKAKGKSATITWRAPALQGTGPVIRYRVTSIPKGGSCTSTKNKCTIQGVKPGRTYKFEVVAETATTVSDPAISRAVKIPTKSNS